MSATSSSMHPLARWGLATLLSLPPLIAHPDHERPVAVEEASLHEPSPMPDRIVLTWTGDPATTQAVTWRTDTSIRKGVAQIALAAAGPQKSEREVEALTTVYKTDINTAHFHTVEFTDLRSDTLYAYRVGDTVNWSEWIHFRTAKSESAPFTFVYFGDAQNDIRTHWSRVFREAFREAPRAAFTLHAGDLINRAQRDAEWGEWFGAPGWVNGSVPVIATPGNHEYYNVGTGPEHQRLWTIKDGSTLAVTIDQDKTADGGVRIQAKDTQGRRGEALLDSKRKLVKVDPGFTTLTGYTAADLADREPSDAPLRDRVAEPGVRTLSGHWKPQFAFPSNGPAGLEESTYFIDYQGVRIISLNSNEKGEAQVPWLRSVLSNNPARWTIITFHHPVFSPARNRDNPELRRLWKPLLDEFKVDLVLTGHDHTYARSGDMSGHPRVGTVNSTSGYNQVYDPEIGTVYVVSVSGPKMYDLTNDLWAVRTAEDTQLFQIISIEGDELRYEARTATNEKYDAFTLKKRQGRANELVESLPPEIRRKK